MTPEVDRIRRTARKISDELDVLNRENTLWSGLRIEWDADEPDLVVFVEIPDDDPFEPTRLDRIFDLVESAIVKRIPEEIPIQERGEPWRVYVQTEGDRALIDGIAGGQKVASRTSRLSAGLGPPSR